MAELCIYPGSSSFQPGGGTGGGVGGGGGGTPNGFYDFDLEFQCDADKTVSYVMSRLGFPIMDVELQAQNVYAAFEEAVTVYGNEVYAFKIRENYLYEEGQNTNVDANDKLIHPHMGTSIRMSEQYGEEIGIGGSTPVYTGSIDLVTGRQYYNLVDFATSCGVQDYDMEVKEVFYQAPPAVTRFFDPYAGSGTGMVNMLDQFGFGQYSPAINFLLMPVSFDMQRIQAIEFNDQVRKSQYSFNITGNQLQIFPIPDGSVSKLFIKYILKSERNYPYGNPEGEYIVTDVSKVPYKNPIYSNINSVGKSWIREYTLALCKEVLGYIRGKYQSIPIPGENVTLNGQQLLDSAATERDKLITKLREYLTDTSREKLMERKNLEADALNKDLGYSPYVIYIG
jgi:hypothetical protein